MTAPWAGVALAESIGTRARVAQPDNRASVSLRLSRYFRAGDNSGSPNCGAEQQSLGRFGPSPLPPPLRTAAMLKGKRQAVA